jgi:hypothetical protein
MTIEEHFDRIAEKHEALARAVELLAAMQKENDQRSAETDKRFSRVVDLIARLENIVESHERRLDKPEGQ